MSLTKDDISRDVISLTKDDISRDVISLTKDDISRDVISLTKDDISTTRQPLLEIFEDFKVQLDKNIRKLYYNCINFRV